MGKLHIIDVFIVAVYFVLITLVGLLQSKKIKTLKDYTLGDREVLNHILVTTIFATWAGSAIVGNVTKLYELGLYYIIPFLVGISLFWLVTKLLFVNCIDRFEGCISISDIIFKLYGKFAESISNFMNIMLGIGAVAVESIAAGLLFNYFFGVSYSTGIFITIGITVFYSISGGIRAVMITDFFQFLVFFIGFPIACGFAYYNITHNTGISILENLPADYLKLQFKSTSNAIHFFTLIIAYLSPAAGAPFIQRLLLAKNKKQLSNAFNKIAVIGLFFGLVLCCIAILAKTVGHPTDSKFVLYHFIDSNLPQGMIGVMVVGMLAIIMSSLDSWLNTTSSIAENAIINPLFPKMREVREARVGLFIIALASIAISLNTMKIMELIWMINSCFFPAMLVPLAAGFAGFKTNSKSFYYGLTFGILTTLCSKIYIDDTGLSGLILGTVANAIGFFSAHYYQVKIGVMKEKKSSDDIVVLTIFKPTLIERIKTRIRKLWFVRNQAEDNKSSYYTFALFIMLLNVPILIFGYQPFTDYLNFVAQYLRHFLLLISLILLVHELFTPKNPLKLWYITLFLALPFFSTYLFILSDYKMMWGINCVASIITLLLLGNLVYSLLISILGGFSAIFLCKLLVGLGNGIVLNNKVIEIELFSKYSVIITFLFILLILYKRMRKGIMNERILEALGHSIVHDVNGPCFVNSGNLYLIREALKDKEYDKIPEYLDTMELSNDIAKRDIKILLENMSCDLRKKPSDWGEYSAKDCLEYAVKHVPVGDDEKNRISLVDINNKKEDFSFTGSETLLRHILFNLIQNSLIHAGSKAQIKLFINEDKIYVKDDGFGIRQETYDKLFEKYTTTIGHGLGLHFCKQAMLKMGGDIECMSEHGKGTQFVLSFDEV